MSDERQLLEEFSRKGSEAAFRQLIERHLGLVYSAALRMVNGDTHQAQDIAQVVFSNLARKARSLPTTVLLAGWLHRDTRYTALEWLRKERRRIGRETEAAAMRELEAGPRADWSLIHPILDEVLDELKDEDRHALLLRFFEQRSLAQVAAALGIAEDAARKRTSRALDQLRGMLARRGVHSTTEALSTAFKSHALMAAPAGLVAAVTAAALAASSASAATVGAGTLTALKLVTMTNLKLALISAVAFAGVATPLILQHQSAARLRAENSSLRQRVNELGRLAADNRRLTARLAEAESRDQTPARPSRELLRLRGEIGVLRQQNQELARLLARNQGTDSNQTADFEPSTSWSDAGTATPEAAAGTFAWAVKTGNTNRLAEVMIWPDEVGTNAAKFLQAMSMILQPTISRIKGSRLVAVTNSPPDEVSLLFQNQLEGGEVQTSPLTLVRVGANWKVKLPLVIDKPAESDGP